MFQEFPESVLPRLLPSSKPIVNNSYNRLVTLGSTTTPESDESRASGRFLKVYQLSVVPLLFLRTISRLRLAVHAALPCLLRIGCRHPASREENEELILDQRGIRSTLYAPGEAWFGDEFAHCLFRGWRYSSHRIQSAGALLSLEPCKKVSTAVPPLSAQQPSPKR